MVNPTVDKTQRLEANLLFTYSPIIADNFGRKLPIAIGCVIMVVGAVLQGACQNLGSTYYQKQGVQV